MAGQANECPNCGGQRHRVSGAAGSIRTCLRCGAVFGSCYLGDSYALVLPFFDADTSMDGCVYFDLTCLGSEGMTRRHGFFRPSTRKLVQVG